MKFLYFWYLLSRRVGCVKKITKLTVGEKPCERVLINVISKYITAMFCPILYLIWDYWQRNLQHFEPSVTIGFISSALSRQGSYRYVQHFIKASFLAQEAIKWFQNWSAVFGLLHKQGQMVKQHIHQARWNSVYWGKTHRDRIFSRCLGPLLPYHTVG